MFTYALGALSLWTAGAELAHVPVLIAAIFSAGFFVIGSQASMLALAIHYYPATCRATGSGWMLGVGRAGGIVGALAGVPLLHLQLSISTMISILAMPAFVAAIAVGLGGFAFIRRETGSVENQDGTVLGSTLSRVRRTAPSGTLHRSGRRNRESPNIQLPIERDTLRT
jgi:hypothetical protein